MDLRSGGEVAAAPAMVLPASQQQRGGQAPVSIPPPAAGSVPLGTPAPPLPARPRVAPPLFEPGAPAPAFPGSQRDSLMGQPPPIAPEIASGSSKLLIVLIAVGLLGGGWMIFSSRGQGSLMSRFVRQRDAIRGVTSRRISVPAQDAQPPAPGRLPLSKPASAPQNTVQQAADAPAVHAPAAPAAAAPRPAPTAAELAADRAAVDFRLAENMLRRHREQQARELLAAIVRKYPDTDSAASAQTLLSQIPLPPPPKPVAAPASAPGPPPRPPTAADDLAQAAQAVASRGTARKPVIPPSLQSARTQAATSTPPVTTLDDVRVVEARFEDNGLHLTLEYSLGSSHTKPVFLGAWMKDPNVSQRLGYTATQMRPGRANARVVLPDLPSTASQLHVIFFEVNGALFFTKDFTLR